MMRASEILHLVLGLSCDETTVAARGQHVSGHVSSYAERMRKDLDLGRRSRVFSRFYVNLLKLPEGKK